MLRLKHRCGRSGGRSWPAARAQAPLARRPRRSCICIAQPPNCRRTPRELRCHRFRGACCPRRAKACRLGRSSGRSRLGRSRCGVRTRPTAAWASRCASLPDPFASAAPPPLAAQEGCWDRLAPRTVHSCTPARRALPVQRGPDALLERAGPLARSLAGAWAESGDALCLARAFRCGPLPIPCLSTCAKCWASSRSSPPWGAGAPPETQN